jgi:hypothetical protein
MKARVLFLLSFFLLAKGFGADPYYNSSIDAKVGYFFFADSKMNDIYKKGGLDLQLSGSFPLWKWLQLYASVEYFQRHGHSHDHHKTNIWEVPATVGLKALIKASPSSYYYITLAPRYFYVHVHNDSPLAKRDLHKNGVGGFVGTGFTVMPYNNFLFDFFGEYSYEKASIPSSKQVGGFVFGIGLGYIF